MFSPTITFPFPSLPPFTWRKKKNNIKKHPSRTCPGRGYSELPPSSSSSSSYDYYYYTDPRSHHHHHHHQKKKEKRRGLWRWRRWRRWKTRYRTRGDGTLGEDRGRKEDEEEVLVVVVLGIPWEEEEDGVVEG